MRAALTEAREEAVAARLRACESRLVRIVRAATADPNAPALAPVGAALAELTGRALDGDGVVALVRAVAGVRPPADATPEIRIRRARDADGLVVSVTLGRSDPPQDRLELEMSRQIGDVRQTFSYSGDDPLDERAFSSIREFWAPCESAPRDGELGFRVRFVR